MNTLSDLLQNFFTHKDHLPPADQIPGTLFTPLHFAFAAGLLALVILGALELSRHKERIRPVFTAIWVVAVVWEVVIVYWESTAGDTPGLDLQTNLSLYPCSLFIYTLPFIIWGRGAVQKMAYGYLCTLGVLGGAVNFIYPSIRLASYSCISFVGFHTFFFHSAIVFTFLVVVLSGMHRYGGVTHWYELLYPAVPSLLLSIPANIVNYSKVGSDYMFFRGELPLFQSIFGDAKDVTTTLIFYGAYILIPALCYLPSYLRSLHRRRMVPAGA